MRIRSRFGAAARTRPGALAAAAVVALAGPGLDAGAAFAQGPGAGETITVTSDGDGSGAAAGVTLRDAILRANATPGHDVIEFDLRGFAPFTIHVEEALPPLAEGVTIDGFSQDGAFDGPLVRLEGPGPGGASFDGLTVAGEGSVVRGLVIVGFGRNGVVLAGDGGHTLEGCHIGVDADGITPAGNGGNGVLVTCSGAVVGGSGDVAPLPGNVIGCNGGNGVKVAGGINDLVLMNAIGTDATGRVPLGNGGSGVLVAGGRGHSIGGPHKGNGNCIANNRDCGVCLADAAAASVMLNSIRENEGPGIRLGDKGGCADDGSCALARAPELEWAAGTAYWTRIAGSVRGLPGEQLRLEFYSNARADDTGAGEGEMLVGVAAVTVGRDGTARFDEVFPQVADGPVVSATATTAGGSTSVFSQCVGVRPS